MTGEIFKEFTKLIQPLWGDKYLQQYCIILYGVRESNHISCAQNYIGLIDLSLKFLISFQTDTEKLATIYNLIISKLN